MSVNKSAFKQNNDYFHSINCIFFNVFKNTKQDIRGVSFGREVLQFWYLLRCDDVLRWNNTPDKKSLKLTEKDLIMKDIMII